MNDFTDLLDYDKFVKILSKEGEKKAPYGLTLLNRFSKYLESLNNKGLRRLAHVLYGQWPHNTDMNIIKTGIKRAIQHHHYTIIYSADHIPQNVQKKDQQIAEQMLLKDEPYVAPQPQHLAKFTPPKKTKKRKRTPVPRQPKKVSKFTHKIQTAELEEVIAWALKEDVPQEKIDAHKDKKLGLAKMNIGNLIRGQLRRKEKLDPWMEMIVIQDQLETRSQGAQ